MWGCGGDGAGEPRSSASAWLIQMRSVQNIAGLSLRRMRLMAECSLSLM